MTPDHIHWQLKALPQGRGLLADDLSARMDPALTKLVGARETDTPAQLRRKAVLRLSGLCDRLPADLRLAALVALNLHSPAEAPLLRDRMAWLGEALAISPRSVRRRVDHALRLLGEQLDDQPEPDTPAAEWHTAALRSLLSLDGESPQLVEQRRIVAEVDGLDEITHSISVPDTPGDAEEVVHSRVVYGGRELATNRLSRSFAQLVVGLPRPLMRGEEHEYSVQFTLPAGRDMRPYYLMTPVRQVHRFDVRVRFDTEDLPRAVWRVDGLPPRVVDDAEPGADLLTPDGVGEVALSFQHLAPGRSYGIQWVPGEAGG